MALRPREPRKRDRKYLAAIAKMPSVISGQEPVHVAHVRYGDAEHDKPPTGLGEKPSDCWVLPLTPEEHTDGVRAQHKSGEREWWASHGIDPVGLCLDLYRIWTDARWPEDERLAAMRRRIVAARWERISGPSV
jgi:hypothetical protein